LREKQQTSIRITWRNKRKVHVIGEKEREREREREREKTKIPKTKQKKTGKSCAVSRVLLFCCEELKRNIISAKDQVVKKAHLNFSMASRFGSMRVTRGDFNEKREEKLLRSQPSKQSSL